MNSNDQPNPILPAAGVRRNHEAIQTSARSPVEHHDGVSLNPAGRGATDMCKRPMAVLRCKKTIQLASFNIQTLTAPRVTEHERGLKTDELFWNMKKYNIEICGIQEHRQVHRPELSDNVNVCKAGLGYQLYTASAWRNDVQAANGGVGIVIGKVAQSELIGVDRISSRIIKASFQGNRALTVIVAYAPCEYADNIDKNYFYNKLRGTIESVPRHNFLVVLGDFNARLGPDDVFFTHNKQTNDNGMRLLELLEDYQLLATNTIFQKKSGKLWTWMSPNKTTHQIDYILTRQKWRKSVTNCEAYGSFATLGSDHRVVTARVRLSLRSPSKSKLKKNRFLWKELFGDRQLQERYAVEVTNRFQVLQEPNDGISKTYEHFVEANQEAANTCLRQIPKVKRKVHSMDPSITRAREEMKMAYKAYEQAKDDPDGHIREEYKRKKRDLYQKYTYLEQQDLLQKVTQIQQANDNYKYGLSWKLINDISGRKATQTARIHGENSTDRINTWYTHFKNLLGKPPEQFEDNGLLPTIFEEHPIPIGPFSMDEYKKAKDCIKCNKSSGEDGVTPEVIKYVPIDELILEIINRAYDEGELPGVWSTLNIIPIPKSGNLTKVDNYRGISLSSVVAKTYNRMILNRIRPFVDPLLRNSQNGFRQDRSTVGQVLALRRILEGVRERNLEAVITFVDFSKAFDSIHRRKLFNILQAYGIPEKLVQAISVTYSNTHAKVCSPDGETDYFEIHRGVLQGDTLAPFLFVIALDYAMRSAISGKDEELGFTLFPRKSRRVPPVMITDLSFADDIALLSDSVVKAGKLLKAVETECKRIGLQVNARKTKTMAINSTHTGICIATSDGATLEVTNDFKYLGSWISSTEHDIKMRRALAWVALHKMMKVWKSTLNDNLKRRLFVATVESVLLYGSETWTLTSKLEKALDGVYTRMLRVALNVCWYDFVSNVNLYANLPRVSVKIRMRRLKLAGHCMRHPELSANPLILWEPKQGNRKRGRCRDTFVNVLKKDTGLSSNQELQTVMQDRFVWRNYVHGARDGTG